MAKTVNLLNRVKFDVSEVKIVFQGSIVLPFLDEVPALRIDRVYPCEAARQDCS